MKIATSPVSMWGVAIFYAVSKYSNLFFSFTFFLNRFHLTLSDELIVGAETTGFMQIIGNL